VIGGLSIARIRPGHVRAVLARVQERGLSAATIAQARGVLGSSLRQAVEEGLIPTNPVTAVKRPRIRRRELHWPTPAQLTDLLLASAGTIWEIPILLSATSGARRSETLGLAWKDVDLRSGIVRICRGVQRMPGRAEAGTIAFTALKTKRARRVVQLPAFVLERIRTHRREQLERRALLGARWENPLDEQGAPAALVCERGDGSFLHPGLVHARFQALRTRGRVASLDAAARRASRRRHRTRASGGAWRGRFRGARPCVPAFSIAVYQHAWQEGPYEAAAALEKALASASSEVGNPLANEVLEAAEQRVSIAN
jgi:integrase